MEAGGGPIAMEAGECVLGCIIVVGGLSCTFRILQ